MAQAKLETQGAQGEKDLVGTAHIGACVFDVATQSSEGGTLRRKDRSDTMLNR